MAHHSWYLLSQTAQPHFCLSLMCCVSFCMRQPARCGTIACCDHKRQWLQWLSSLNKLLYRPEASVKLSSTREEIRYQSLWSFTRESLAFLMQLVQQLQAGGWSHYSAGHSGAVVNMYIWSVWKSRAAADPPTIAYGSTMCYLMRDLLTQTTKCVAHLRSHGRGVFACVACKLTL